MYNSKPSSVSHKDGGDNSLIPAWSFLSLPWLLRLDLARNLMTLLAALSHSESCSCHSWPRGAIWDTPEPLTHVRTAFQIWSAQLLHPPPTLDKATGAVWFYFFFLLLKWPAACTCCVEEQFYTTHLLWNTLPEAIMCIDPSFTKEVNSPI